MAGVETLSCLSQSAIGLNLGKLAQSVECHFSCGGTIPDVEKVFISYKKKSGDWSSRPLELPSASPVSQIEDVQDFLDACSTASETVIDKEYCDALKLHPASFYASFDIANTCILNLITRIMSSTPIRAELYMLNVYSTGGRFKSHVGTPRSADMFGSLVVCLPSKFTGGALVTQHQDRQVTFDWSSTAATQWAAFYNDVKHEVLPITSGHRITLTYNLYHTPAATPLSSALNVTTNPFYQELKAALQNPHFMRKGGTLGFFCQHKYTGISSDLEEFSPFLKREDAIVYEIAKSIGLPISLKPVCEAPFMNKSVLSDICDIHTRYIIPKFHPKAECYYLAHLQAEVLDDEYTLTVMTVMRDHFGDGIVTDDDVMWCQINATHIEAVVELYEEDNQPAGCEIYQAAAFLVVVPEFTSQRGSV